MAIDYDQVVARRRNGESWTQIRDDVLPGFYADHLKCFIRKRTYLLQKKKWLFEPERVALVVAMHRAGKKPNAIRAVIQKQGSSFVDQGMIKHILLGEGIVVNLPMLCEKGLTESGPRKKRPKALVMDGAQNGHEPLDRVVPCPPVENNAAAVIKTPLFSEENLAAASLALSGVEMPEVVAEVFGQLKNTGCATVPDLVSACARNPVYLPLTVTEFRALRDFLVGHPDIAIVRGNLRRANNNESITVGACVPVG